MLKSQTVDQLGLSENKKEYKVAFNAEVKK